MKVTRAPDGNAVIHLAPDDPPGLAEFWWVHRRRFERAVTGSRAANTGSWHDAIAAVEIREAFVKLDRKRGVVARERKRAGLGEVVKGWPDAKVRKLYQPWADKVCSGGMWSKGRAALAVTKFPDTGSGKAQSAKLIRRAIALHKRDGKTVVEWRPNNKRIPRTR